MARSAAARRDGVQGLKDPALTVDRKSRDRTLGLAVIFKFAYRVEKFAIAIKVKNDGLRISPAKPIDSVFPVFASKR